MPARYRVRTRGRTLIVWDKNEHQAVRTALEWLDHSDKAGFRPDAEVKAERIGDDPKPDDLLGTTEGRPA